MPSNESIIPTGYAAVPIDRQQSTATLRICVLCKLKPDASTSALVVLRDHLDAQVFLGCILDAAGRAIEWIEIWTQRLEGVANSLGVVRDALSNTVLDNRWRQYSEAVSALYPSFTILTGSEQRHPSPTWIDLVALLPSHDPTGSVEPQSDSWQLCVDDALLRDAGLEPFSTSLQRYLYCPDEKNSNGFREAIADTLPTTGEAAPTRIPFNPGAGLLQVRRYQPIDLEGFADLLAGAPIDALLHGRSALPLDLGLPPGGVAGLNDEWMFMGRHGQLGRTLESFHLKLRLFADAVNAVRSIIQRTQQPLLNLSIDHLRIDIGAGGAGLPRLWTARTVLTEPGCAVELSIPNSDLHYYLQGKPVGQSIYLPAQIDSNVVGRASVRIRKVVNHAGGGTIVEGTLATQERITPSPSDLIWLRLNLSGHVLDLYAHLEAEPALARGEWRFRTIAQRLPETIVAAVRAAEGIPLARAPFELIPLLSSPCDLYSLAVIGVRMFLVDSQTTLAMAFDEVMSLAAELAHGHDRSVPIRDRIARIFASDPRWANTLGPQRLCFDSNIEGIADLIPPKLWGDLLALIVSMLPGVGPDSLCSDLGDARPGNLHLVFDPALTQLNSLLVRTRSLIVIDWRYNREIHAVIRERELGLESRPAARRTVSTIAPLPSTPPSPSKVTTAVEPTTARTPRIL